MMSIRSRANWQSVPTTAIRRTPRKMSWQCRYTTQASPGNSSNGICPRESSTRASPNASLSSRYNGTDYAHAFSTKRPQSTAQGRGRASYSTETSVAGEPVIHDVFETGTSTWQYVVADPSTSTAVIIDPVLDYDPATQSVTTTSADGLLSLAKNKDYKIDKILETHAHADHLTAASYIQSRLAQEQDHTPPICIGQRIGQVQKTFGQRYAIPPEEYEGVFGRYFADGETFEVGKLTATVIDIPGHTPDHLGYRIGDNVFCGDSIFHADIGTARSDFPGGSARSLYHSGHKLLSLPDSVKVWTGHDYPSQARGAPVPWMTVGEHKKQNKHLMGGITEDEFVTMRMERDKQLAQPKLLHQSLQVNIRAGRLPKPTETGHRLLHLPLNLHGVEW